MNHMSDWTDDEYNNMLGLLDEKEYPDQIIPHSHQDVMHNKNFKYPDRPQEEPVNQQRLLAESDEKIPNFFKDDENMGDFIKRKIHEHTGLKIERPDLTELGVYKESSWAKRNDGMPSVVTKVKNQGRMCSASYAFAIVAALEAAQAIEEGHKPIELSEQQIIDCTFDGSHQNFGCLGGSLGATIKYVTHKPILSAKTYPYVEA